MGTFVVVVVVLFVVAFVAFISLPSVESDVTMLCSGMSQITTNSVGLTNVVFAL